MKRLLKSLLAMMLCVILPLSVMACNKKDPQDKQPKPVAIVAVDGVNVQNVIEALGPISESEYLTINVDFGMSSTEVYDDNTEMEATSFSAEFKVRKTSSGYDFIARIVDESMDTYTYEAPNSDLCIVLYYVNGRMVVAYEMAGQVISAMEAGGKMTFNGLINELNREIANDPEVRQIYEQIVAMTEEVKALFEQGVMANLNEELDIDLAEDVNNAFAYFKANSHETLFDLFLKEAGIEKTVAEVEEIIFAVVDELCADNPTLSQFIGRVVAVINEDLAPEEQINLREICDAIEAEGLNVTALCQLVNYIAGEEILYEPQEETSLFEYLDNLASAIRVDQLAQMILAEEDATVTDLVADFLNTAKKATLCDVAYEILEMDVSVLDFAAEELWASATLKTDSQSRLTSLSLEYAVDVSIQEGEYDQLIISSMANLELTISYDKFTTEMVIPQKVLNAI